MTMFNINMNVAGSRSGYRYASMILLLTLLMAVSGGVQAQPGGLDDDPGQSVPVDGGLSLLLGAGVCYGVRQMKTRVRQRNETVKDRPGS